MSDFALEIEPAAEPPPTEAPEPPPEPPEPEALPTEPPPADGAEAVEPPAETVETPAETTEGTVDKVAEEPPAEGTEAPGKETTEPPADGTEVPAEGTEAPSEQTDKPPEGEDEGPSEATEAPTEGASEVPTQSEEPMDGEEATEVAKTESVSEHSVEEEENEEDDDEDYEEDEDEAAEEQKPEEEKTELPVVEEEPEEIYYIEEEEVVEEEEIPFVSVFERLDAPRELLPPLEITPEMLKNISVQLGQIRLCWPKKTNVVLPTFMTNVILPDGYLINTNKEKLLLLYCENFRQQYHSKFTNRKPLLMAADNVVGQRKMVCTALRPTTLSSPYLSTWQELASFLADFITYEPMNPPTDLSSRLFAPATIVNKRIGHSFEISNALCSLLLGRNYNAYVVYGFATKDVTERIMTRTDCPFVEEEETVEEVKEEEAPSKYALKPPRDLRSKFLLAMEQKEIDKVKRKQEKILEEEKKKRLELEKPPFDELHGRRLHGWVLMLPHERDKDKEDVKPFFIEPSTGMRHEVDTELYCSIQSVWNNVNYWVNLQDDSLGVGNLDYDLTKIDKWEHLLAGEPIEERRHAKNIDMDDEEYAQQEEYNMIMDEKHLDAPEPWSLRIVISNHDEVTRFPKGRKTTNYKRTIVEEYSPYIQEDGLVIKIYRYTDLDYTDLISIEERYEHRNDKLLKRKEVVATGLITEYFDRGREDNAKLHYFYKEDNFAESWRKIEFYYQSRFDCLESINHDVLKMTENYVDREDKFYFREVQYAPRGEPPPGFLEGPRRIIMHVLEKFHRSEGKRASDDIAQREFDFIGRCMHLKFHYDKGKITASTRTFMKPPLTEMVEGVSFKPELSYGYQAEIGANPAKNSTLYSLLEHQIKDEDECNLKVRFVEDQISEFLRIRSLELLNPKLDVGLFNREQNKDQRQGMLEKELQERTKKEREIEEDLDYLQPYLVRINQLSNLNCKQALKVKFLCIKEYKELLVKRQNDLQQRIQKQLQWIEEKHTWYTQELENLIFEEEQEYFREMNEGKFLLHTLFIRLSRHRDLAPVKYQTLLNYLEDHPMLAKLKHRKPKEPE